MNSADASEPEASSAAAHALAAAGAPAPAPARVSGNDRIAALDTAVASPSAPLRIASITVQTGRLTAFVEIPQKHCRYTNAQIARRVEADFPALPHHACVNARGRTFGCVVHDTSLPHLLEHLAIEFQTQQAPDPRDTYVGTSEWIDERAGTARVQLSFKDDLAALGALRHALDYLNDLLKK